LTGITKQTYYSEETIFKKVLADNTSYPEKLRFYAFYSYLSKKPDSAQSFYDGLVQPELMQWVRVIYNLTENTVIDSIERFSSALASIEALSQFDTPILPTFISNTDISFFSENQVLEERIKAHLLLKSENWYSAIIEAENHSYFKGQIGFLLEFSGILSFYTQHKNCEWDVVTDEYLIKEFQRYTESAGNVFKFIENNIAKVEYKYLWERSVLTKGKYFINRGIERFSLLSVRTNEQNINRDYSWRRLLRIDMETTTKRGYVKAIFDDPDFNCDSEQNLESSLQLICDKAIANNCFEYWREAFIKYPEIFDRCGLGFIAVIGKEIFLYNKYQRNHLHDELYTKILELELTNIQLDYPDLLHPFTKLEYRQVRSGYESAGLHIKHWKFKNQLLKIEITKESNHFNIYFKNNTLSSYPEQIKNLLLDLGFAYIKSEQELDTVGSHNYFISTKQTTVKGVINELEGLCAKLRAINNE